MANHDFSREFETELQVDLVEELLTEKELVVHNDDVNTFDHVIQSLIEVCEHTPEQAEQCTLLVHFRGQATVKHGDYDALSPMVDGLHDRGIDATIE